jgi:FixJ family two-component response regulator
MVFAARTRRRAISVAHIPVISIVDDDAWSRSGLEDLVLSLGYRARTFESAERFVESGSVGDTDCLITDLRMPGWSGLELQSHLRRAGHRIPTIFVTTYPNDTQRARALEEGAIGFLDKPFDERALVAFLARAVARG